MFYLDNEQTDKKGVNMFQNVYFICGILASLAIIVGVLLSIRKRKTHLSQKQKFEGSGKVEQEQEVRDE